MAKYGKSYGTKEEYQYRRDLFEKSLTTIANSNSRNDVSYTLALN
jgi:hypothetical protein